MKTEIEIRDMYARYQEGATLEEIGRDEQLSHTRVGQLFDELGLPKRSPVLTRRMRTSPLHEIYSQEEIQDLYRELGSVGRVYERVHDEGITRSYIETSLKGMEDRDRFRKAGGGANTPLYNERSYINALRIAYEFYQRPLTTTMYRDFTTLPETSGSFPSLQSCLRFFSGHGEPPWQRALRLAEIPGLDLKVRGMRPVFTFDECVASIREWLADSSATSRSYTRYTEWAKENGRISGPTIRLRMKWREILDLALDNE